MAAFEITKEPLLFFRQTVLTVLVATLPKRRKTRPEVYLLIVLHFTLRFYKSYASSRVPRIPLFCNLKVL
jgi:hypothetical protein